MKTYIKLFIQFAFFLLVVLSLGVVVAQAQEEGEQTEIQAEGEQAEGQAEGQPAEAPLAPVPTPQPEDMRPRLRIVNASLGIPNADIYVNNTLFFENVGYSYISNYVPVAQTDLKLRVRPAGVKDVSPVTERGWNFEGNRDYTMVIMGTSENIDEIWVFDDDNKNPLGPGQTRVRIVHTSYDASTVEICLDKQCQKLTRKEITWTGGSKYLTLDAGTYQLSIRLLGMGKVYYDVLPLTFEAGQVYSIFILDPAQGEIKPRIVPHVDTGYLLPQPPGDIGHPLPYPPGGGGQPLPYPPGSGQPPLYPPVTGVFLSPTVLILITVLILTLLGGLWIARRRFIKT